MARIRDGGKATCSNLLAIECLGLLLVVMNVLASSAQSGAPEQSDPRVLGQSDLRGLLDCATRPNELLAVQPDAYGENAFRVRYEYPVLPGRETNMLNWARPANWVSLILYHRDGRSAALLEVNFEGPRSGRTFTLLDGANLERMNGQWTMKNILNGVGSTWPEIARHVKQASTAPLVIVPRAAVKRSAVVCEFPPSGLTFTAVSIDGDRSNWNFKDGVSNGVPFQSQSGPYKNSDLKRTPSSTIYMNTYGPS